MHLASCKPTHSNLLINDINVVKIKRKLQEQDQDWVNISYNTAELMNSNPWNMCDKKLNLECDHLSPRSVMYLLIKQ